MTVRGANPWPTGGDPNHGPRFLSLRVLSFDGQAVLEHADGFYEVRVGNEEQGSFRRLRFPVSVGRETVELLAKELREALEELS